MNYQPNINKCGENFTLIKIHSIRGPRSDNDSTIHRSWLRQVSLFPTKPIQIISNSVYHNDRDSTAIPKPPFSLTQQTSFLSIPQPNR